MAGFGAFFDSGIESGTGKWIMFLWHWLLSGFLWLIFKAGIFGIFLAMDIRFYYGPVIARGTETGRLGDIDC